ncbi:MAG: hypothetical protein ACTHN0_03875 [Aquihabitans sp.]
MISRRAARRTGDGQFERFRPRPGSNYIASGFALARFIELVEAHRPRAILEVGAGIGAITDTVLAARERAGCADGLYVAVEDIPFCLEQLASNLGPRMDQVTVVPRASAIPPELGPFDLVIVDGAATEDLFPEDRHLFPPSAQDDEVRAWVPRIAPGGIVAVENVRRRQREVLEQEARRPFVHEHLRPLDDSPGVHLYRFEPDGLLKAVAGTRNAVRPVWFDHGLPLAKKVFGKVLHRPFPGRSAVAPGDHDWSETRRR